MCDLDCCFPLLLFVFCLIRWWLLLRLLECGSCIKTCPGTISDEPGIWTLIQFRLRFFLSDFSFFGSSVSYFYFLFFIFYFFVFGFVSLCIICYFWFPCS
ncbi:hypothetical protein Hanom_Chr09g00863871 [Helianthus anomalus]